MGQILNIEIKKDNKTLANAYYHWSAYSATACRMTQQIVNYINKNPQKCDDVLYAIRILENTGAGLSDSFGLETAKEMFPNEKFAECKGRNSGLLAITDSGIEFIRYWEEGRVTIDLDRQIVNFEVYFEYAPEDEDSYNIKPQFEKLNLDLENLKFVELDELSKQIEYAANTDRRIIFELANGERIQFIY